MNTNASSPLVSILIPTRNVGKSLEKSLISLKKQTYKNIEIIIIDNNSSDNTKEIAKKYTPLVFDKGPERIAQVNFGAAIAKGKYIYYTGSDTVRDEDLIEQAVEKCEKDNYDAIYIDYTTIIENPNIWQKVRSLERKCYYKEPGMSSARFYKREVFLEKLGGFDEKIGPISDDLEFQHRLDINGFKTGFINAEENNFGDYDSWKIIVTRSLYYGWFLTRYFDKHPKKTKKQYKLIRDEFVKHKDLLTADKKIFIAFVFYKLTQYACAGISLFLAKTTNNSPAIEKFLFELNYGKKVNPAAPLEAGRANNP